MSAIRRILCACSLVFVFEAIRSIYIFRFIVFLLCVFELSLTVNGYYQHFYNHIGMHGCGIYASGTIYVYSRTAFIRVTCFNRTKFKIRAQCQYYTLR